MCRHLGYLGPALPVAELILDRPHSLLRQSWAPADMRGGGTINADGFGVGWYPGPSSPPVVYRRATPMWSDAGLPGVARAVAGTSVLAATRSATVGMPVIETACAPFLEGRWLFSHNGIIAGWPHSVADIAGRLSVVDLITLDAPTDSALLWALVRGHLRQGVPLDKAVEYVVADVAAAAPGSKLNVMATDGHTLVATAWTHSLSTLATSDRVVLASEPLDDDERWSAVPDRHLVVATRTDNQVVKLIVRPLDVAGDEAP